MAEPVKREGTVGVKARMRHGTIRYETLITIEYSLKRIGEERS